VEKPGKQTTASLPEGLRHTRKIEQEMVSDIEKDEKR
jgi:hypothetical protein